MKSTAVSTVFIIDDDRGMRQAIHDLVESVGLRAESFATGEEFLGRKHIGRPSCLVLDVRLPQMSGLDFQRRLAESGLRIPIIFVTAHGDIPMSVKALKSGAVEFLTKPFRDRICWTQFSKRSSGTISPKRDRPRLQICKSAITH
jgi:FixJ family two-component response regulator